MSNAGLSSIDARVMASMLRAGLADAAVYSDGVSPVNCSVMIERDTQIIGESGQVVGQKTSVVFLRAEVPKPKQRATVTVTANGEQWTLESKFFEDESISQWILNRG